MRTADKLRPGDVIAVRPTATGALTVTVPEHPDACALQLTAPARVLPHAVHTTTRAGRPRRTTVHMLRVTGTVCGRPAAVSIPPTATIWAADSLCDWPAAQASMGAAA